MNPDSPIDPRQALESSLTALLLGELPHEQAAALHQKLAQEPELAKLYERLKHTINLVRETIASPVEQPAGQPAPLKLSDQRRQKLLQQFKTVAPKEFAQPRRRRVPTLIELGIAAGLVAILGALLLPALGKAKSKAMSSRHSLGFRTFSLSKDKESAAPAPALKLRTLNSPDLNRRTDRFVVEGTTPLATRAGVATPPAKSASPVIVLPQSGELAEATTPPPVLESVNSWSKPAPAGRREAGMAWGTLDGSDKPAVVLNVQATAANKGFYDDSSDRVGGGSGGAAGGFVFKSSPGGGGQGGGASATFGGAPASAAADSLRQGYTGLTRGDVQGLSQSESQDALKFRAFSSRLADAVQQASPNGSVEAPPPAAVPPPPDAGPAPAQEGEFRQVLTSGLRPKPTGSYYGGAYGGYSGQTAPSGGDQGVAQNTALRSPKEGGPAGWHGGALLGPPPSSPQETVVNETASRQVELLPSLQTAPAFKGTPKDVPVVGAVPVTGRLFHSMPEAAGGSFKAELEPSSAPPAGGKQGGDTVFFANSALTAPSSTTISGYAGTSYEWNLGTGNGNVPSASRTYPNNKTAGDVFFSLDPETHRVVKIADAAPQDVNNNLQDLFQRSSVRPQSSSVNPMSGQNNPLDQREKANTQPASQGATTGFSGGSGANSYSLNVVNSANVPQTHGSHNAGVISQLSTGEQSAGSRQLYRLRTDANNASQPAPSSIVLPPAQPETSLALLNNGPSINVGQGFFYSKGSPESQNSWVRNFTVGGDSVAAANQPVAAPADAEDTRKQGTEDAAKTRPYVEAKQQLDELQRFRQILDLKIASEKIDAELPKTTMVEIVDTAKPPQPAQSPSLWDRVRGKGTGEFKSTARIKVERDQPDITGMAERGGSVGYDPYFVQTEFEAIQSEPILGKVIKELNLNEAWGKKQGGRTLTTAETMALLKKNLDLQPEKNTSLIDVGVKSDNPEEAARIANAVAKAYKEHRSEQRMQLSMGGINALEEGIAKLDQKVASAKAELERLGSEAKKVPDEKLPAGALNFEQAKPDQLLDLYGKLVNRTILRQATLPAPPITFSASTPLTKQQAVQALEGALALNGITMVNAGDKFVKAVAEAQGNTAGAAQLPELGQSVTHVVQLHHVKPSELVEAIQPLAKTPNSILPIDSSQLLVLRDSLENVKRMSEMIAKVDVATPEYVSEVIPIKHGKASDIAGALNSLAAPKPAASAPIPQPEVQTADNAFSTFSLNVSDVSFKLAAPSLEKGLMPDPATVRSEEFINAFDYRDPEPPPGVPVAFAWERAQYPFAQNRDLLRFSIKTAAQGRQPGRPLNLVLLLDNSGSMERADRVQIIHEALRVLAGQLQPQDKFSVVIFARTARLWVDGVPGSQAAQVAEEVSGLTPQGGTNLEDAMNLAYQTALRHYLPNGINRVVLLTDGAANLGDVDPEALKQKVEANRKQGVALDCFGIGWEGYNDDLLEVLSRNGDGRYAFINTPEEAGDEFAAKLAGALQVAASDVKVQVEFNPSRVTAYRQIGYAKHQLTKEQFRDNTVNAAQIGAAEAGNALYVVAVNPGGSGPLGTVRVRFRIPGTADYREHAWDVPYTGNAVALEQASPAMRLAAAGSALSEWLVTSPYAAEVTPDRLLGYLSGVPEVYGADARPKKLEWMIRQAKSIAGK